MRLLILTPEYTGSGGGIMTYYQTLVPALVRAGVSVRIIEGSRFVSALDKRERVDCGASVETLELARLRRWYKEFDHLACVPGLRWHMAAAWAVWEQSGYGEGVDVIEACDWGLLCVPPGLDASAPVLVQSHGSIGQIAQHDPLRGEEVQSSIISLIERDVLSRADGLQTLSNLNADYWQTATQRHISVCRPAWHETITGRPASISKRALVTARVQHWKGPQILCEAIKNLDHSNLEIDWVGRDTCWGSSDQSASSVLRKTYPGIWGKRIMHLSPESSASIRQRQASTFVNIIPSEWDVFNMTVVESMTSGRPTIVSTGAGAHELVVDGENGYVFRSGNAGELARAIERVLMSTPEQQNKMGESARATVSHALDPDKIVAQRIATYESCVDSFQSGPRRSPDPSISVLCRPNNSGPHGEDYFLSQLPARALLNHTFRRFADRLKRKLNAPDRQRS